jgi:hypothetical protein
LSSRRLTRASSTQALKVDAVMKAAFNSDVMLDLEPNPTADPYCPERNTIEKYLREDYKLCWSKVVVKKLLNEDNDKKPAGWVARILDAKSKPDAVVLEVESQTKETIDPSQTARNDDLLVPAESARNSKCDVPEDEGGDVCIIETQYLQNHAEHVRRAQESILEETNAPQNPGHFFGYCSFINYLNNYDNYLYSLLVSSTQLAKTTKSTLVMLSRQCIFSLAYPNYARTFSYLVLMRAFQEQ